MTQGRLESGPAKSFDVYLRTGRLPVSHGAIETKFNPWHDPEDGRFTFVGQGRYFGGGSQTGNRSGFGGGGASGSWGKDRFDPRNPQNYTLHIVKPGDTLTGIARLRKGVTAQDLAWLNAIPFNGTLRIGQKLKLPNQAYLDAGRDAKNRFIALDLYMQTHGGHLPPDAAHPPPRSKRRSTIRRNGIRLRRTDIGSTATWPNARARSKGRYRSMRRPNAPGAVREKPVARIAGRLMMGAIILLSASTAPATPSTISRRTPTSIAAPIGSWRIVGQQACEPGIESWSTSCHTMMVSLAAPIKSRLRGLSTAKNIPALSQTKMEANAVASDKYDILGPLYSEIGHELAEIVGGDPNGVYLYAEAGQGWVGPSVFKDEGNAVHYFRASSHLCNLLLKAWETEEPDKRWAVMEYTIIGTTFDAKFKFPDEIDPAETEVDRRPVALKARYGDKPIVYPPAPPGMMEFKGNAD